MTIVSRVPRSVVSANATAATRWVGGTTTGAPSAGTWAVGDFVVAQDGKLWICTSAGTPGTWVSPGAVSSVAGRTGAVVLTAADIGAGSFPAGSFTITGALTATGVVTGQIFDPDGLTGATSASRYVGGINTLPPSSGTFALGDFVIAQNGHIWVCTSAGSPDTWSDAAVVTAVAGRTGAVTLTAADIGGGTFPSGTFTMPNGQGFTFTMSSGASGIVESSGTQLRFRGGTGGFAWRNSGDTLDRLQLTDAGLLTCLTANHTIDCQVGGISLPRGRVASGQITANYTAVTAATEVMVTNLTATFTFVAGRRYKVSAYAVLQNNTAVQGTSFINVRYASGTSVTLAGTMILSSSHAMTATANWRHTHAPWVEITCVASGATGNQINAGQQTVGVSVQIPSANSLVVAGATQPAQILVEDIGV